MGFYGLRRVREDETVSFCSNAPAGPSGLFLSLNAR
jgi:hypothetical protein